MWCTRRIKDSLSLISLDLRMQSKTTVELSSAASSIKNGSDVEDVGNDKQQEIKIALVGQMKVPVYQKPHFWSPDFVKCDGKIIKYDLRALGIWRVSHPLLCGFIYFSQITLL